MSSLASKATNELVTPLFFVRLVFGFSAEVKAVQDAVQSNIIRVSTDDRPSTSSTTLVLPRPGGSSISGVNPVNSISHMVGSAIKVDDAAAAAAAGEATKESDTGDRRPGITKRAHGSITESLRGSDLLVVRETHDNLDNYDENEATSDSENQFLHETLLLLLLLR